MKSHQRMSAVRELGKGMSALVALMSLLVGVPVALLALAGWPLPQRVPRLESVGHALSQSQIPDEFWVKAAAVVCWIAWLILVICVLVELVAWVGGYAARRLPVVGPVQLWIARLVASALLVFSSFVGLVRPVAAAPLRSSSPPTQVAPRLTHRPLRVVRAPEAVGVASPEEAAVGARPVLPEPA